MKFERLVSFRRVILAMLVGSASVVASLATPAWAQIVLQLGGDGTATVQGGAIAIQDGKLQMPIMLQGGGGWQGVAGQGWQDYQSWNVPGFGSLAQELVRKELELVPEQAEDIKKVAKEFQGKMREVYAPLQNRELSNEDRQKLYQEMQQRLVELNKEADQQVRKILLPHQIKTLETAELRMRIGGMLQYGQVLERAGLTEEQRKDLLKNRVELAQKMYDLQKEAFEDALKILTPEQIDKLKNPMYGGAQAGGSPKK